jgi:hypothetical protein
MYCAFFWLTSQSRFARTVWSASYEDPVVMPTCVGACRQPSGKRVTRSA